MTSARVAAAPVWGDNDNLGPSDGPVGSFFRARASRLGASRFEEIAAGHVPQDDDPETTNRILTGWLASLAPAPGEQREEARASLS